MSWQRYKGVCWRCICPRNLMGSVRPMRLRFMRPMRGTHGNRRQAHLPGLLPPKPERWRVTVFTLSATALISITASRRPIDILPPGSRRSITAYSDWSRSISQPTRNFGPTSSNGSPSSTRTRPSTTRCSSIPTSGTATFSMSASRSRPGFQAACAGASPSGSEVCRSPSAARSPNQS